MGTSELEGAAGRTVRVLIAEDSPTVRHYLTTLINETPGMQVIGEARDGMEALDKAEELRPDVISMDVRMPRLDGLEATRRIMARTPMPIVIVSSLVDEDINLAFTALQAGALAVVAKPPDRFDPNFPARKRQLTSTLSAMAAVKVVRRWDRPTEDGQPEVLPHTNRLHTLPEIVAVGASAGGPSALSRLLAALPGTFPLPVLVVQHLPDEFMIGLARWLDEVAPLKVRMAEDGMALEGGTVYLSPGGVHLQVARRNDGLVARLNQERTEHRYCPSVNVLFRSVAQVCGGRSIGVILTGMGDDGADGLAAIRSAGGRTFAQDRESCTVFGMPSAAIERGAVQHVLPLGLMAAALLQRV